MDRRIFQQFIVDNFKITESIILDRYLSFVIMRELGMIMVCQFIVDNFKITESIILDRYISCVIMRELGMTMVCQFIVDNFKITESIILDRYFSCVIMGEILWYVTLISMVVIMGELWQLDMVWQCLACWWMMAELKYGITLVCQDIQILWRSTRGR